MQELLQKFRNAADRLLGLPFSRHARRRCEVGQDDEPLRRSTEIDRVDGQSHDAREEVGSDRRQRTRLVVRDAAR